MASLGDEVEPSELLLYKRILLWNYYDMWTKAEKGENYGFVEGLQQLPLTFQSAEEYIAAFEPLMLEEYAAVMLRGLEETQLVGPEKCITGPVKEADGFQIAQFLLESAHAYSFGYSDMILLTSENPNGPHASNEALNALGMLDSHANESSLWVRFYLDPDSFRTKPRERQRMLDISERLKAGSGWWLTRITALSTSIREWNALHAIAKVNFRETIFSAKQSCGSAKATSKVPQALNEALAAQYNESQMKALCGGLSGQEVVLIQGPPGTGKTKTLLGLLSSILYAMPEGSLGLKKARTADLRAQTANEATRIWLDRLMRPCARDEVKAWEKGSPTDEFGMARMERPFKVGERNKPSAHVLVCAPSNSALDEIVLRLLGGILDRKGRTFHPKVVRIGLSVHHSVQSVSLDTLVSEQLSRVAPSKIMQRLFALGTWRAGSGTRGFTQAKMHRDRVKQEIMEGAHIVASTLSYSGSRQLKQLARPFDVVVIDEAAQAVEPSTLIPLCTGAKQVYLIGDPVQLPATVISKAAITYKYDMSMFKRLQSAGYPVNILDTQYRMHPKISAYPSTEFYHGNLRNGPGVAEVTARPWHQAKCLGPFAFINARGKETKPYGSSSLENTYEAQLIMSLYANMAKAYPELRDRPTFGIVSPYLAQVQLLRRLFEVTLGVEQSKALDINTIDGFQGREKDVVIFSAVRTARTRNIGFVADERRINVGLTRARCSLLVVGHGQALERSARWQKLLRHARASRCFFTPTQPFADYFSNAIAGRVEPEGPTAKDLQELAKAEELRRQSDGAGDDEEGIYSEDEFAPALNAAVKEAAEPRATTPPVENTDDQRPEKKPRIASASSTE